MSETTTTTNKKYELRKLQISDTFLVTQIIKKIGVDQFKNCFKSDEMNALLSTSDQSAVETLGTAIVIDIAATILSNINEAEDDIYMFLSSLSGLDRADIEKMDIDVLPEMISDIIHKKEFASFMGVVSKLF